LIRDDKQVYKTNQEIKAEEVRLLGPDNKQIGVLKLTDALKKAEERESLKKENLKLKEWIQFR